MDTTILMKGIISIFTYWLQFNVLFILCDLDIVTNTTNNILGLNQTNGKSNNNLNQVYLIMYIARSFLPASKQMARINNGNGRLPCKFKRQMRRVGGIKNLGFTLKSPLGYNKQIKTAKALIIQQYTQQKAFCKELNAGRNWGSGKISSKLFISFRKRA